MGTIEQTIINEYRRRHDSFVKFDSFVYEKLEDTISEHDLFLFGISHRVKTVMSLDEKLGKKKGKYTSLFDITDLIGFRIITFFSDTVDVITELLPNLFEIDKKNSVDKRKNLMATEFGYVSVHYICSLKEEDLENHPEFRGIRFEIQLRSALQHAWAEIEHDLGYKSEFGIPIPMRREFSRVAGLLEIADNQFIELRENIRRYESDVKDKIRNNMAGDITLDRVSLREFVTLSKSFNELLEEIKNTTGVEIQIIDPVNYLERLSFIKIKTLGDMVDLIENNREEAMALCIDKLNEMDLDITTSNMILRFLCKAEIIRMGYPESFIRKFIGISVADPDRVEKYVEQYLENSNTSDDNNYV